VQLDKLDGRVRNPPLLEEHLEGMHHVVVLGRALARPPRREGALGNGKPLLVQGLAELRLAHSDTVGQLAQVAAERSPRRRHRRGGGQPGRHGVLHPCRSGRQLLPDHPRHGECGVMAVGVTGTCIISLQSWLNIFDDAGLVVDGDFGPATEAAVRNFQGRHGLVPDGRFGDASRNALRGVFQYMMDNSVATPKPGASLACTPSTGVNCDVGGAVPGANGGLIQTLICNGVGEVGRGPYGLGAEIFCEVLLS
jgi:hypothetical protein